LLVAEYCSTPVTVQESDDCVPKLATKEGTLSGTVTVCSYLASLAPAALASQLVGATKELEAEVADWLSRSSLSLADVDQDALKAVDTSLATRTLLVGTAVTLADLVVFGSVAPIVSSLAPAELSASLCNLARWFDYVFGITGAAKHYKAPTLKRAIFKPPAELYAPPAAPAKAEKGGDKAASKGDDKAPAKDGKGGKAEGGKADAAAAAPAAKAKGEGEKKEGGGEKKEKKEKKPKELPTKKEVSLSVSILDIRVGTIVKCGDHPSADALYVEEIDLGEDKPRQVVSGLKKFIPLERMQGARVLVLCNVKPGKLRDVMSNGMVLCASNADHTQVDFVQPPEGVPNGERITFKGVEGEPEPVLNPKKKQFDALAPGLKTDANGVAGYEGNPFQTTKGPCTSPKMPGCNIK